MKIALDADLVVHLIATDSPRNAATVSCYEGHRKGGDEFVLAENALLEAFSVLTRAPKPFATPGREAERILRAHFGTSVTAPIRPGLALEAIRHTLDRGFAGGRVYDAAIALATYEAGARLLLTWNVRHFISVAPVGLEVRHP